MAPAIGPITARKLIGKAGSAGSVFSMSKEALESIEGIGPRVWGAIRTPGLKDQAKREVEFLDRHRIHAHYFEDPGYPARLNQWTDGPVILYSRGTLNLNTEKSLSVVGTRRASSYGRDLCREIIKGLSEHLPGLVIVSGLAYGIDVMAHRAALEYGLPTVAVLAHGLSTLYPASHRDTAERIISQGALVTDFDSGMGPERNNFLRRNRIIAGFSQATLVVESPEKGGALITASMASSYNRDILAVPGRAGDPRSRGCNNLIKRSMAALTESHEDILRHLNWETSTDSEKKALQPLDLSSDEKKILLHVENTPGITPDSLSNLTGFPVSMVLAMLLEMELKQWVSVEPGNRYRCRISALP